MVSKQNQLNKNMRLWDCVNSNKPTAEKLIAVRRCLEQRADVNTTDDEGNTPLHLAVRRAEAIIVKLLLKRGANVNTHDIHGNTPLHDAASSRVKSIVKLLLDKGANAMAQAKNGDTPLHKAAQSGDMAVVELLLKSGGDVNAQTKSGYSPLHVAAQFGLTCMAQLLLNKGADAYLKDLYGSTTLHEAASSGETSIVELLLNKGINLSAKDRFGYTPLHRAASSRETSVIELMLTKGADVNVQAINGVTPLHEAAKSGDIYVVELLLAKGAKVNPFTINGDTPLHRALRSGEMSVVKLLLNRDADINVTNVNGDTPLHKAAQSGDMSVVELMLSKGADVNAQVINGDTSLHKAVQSEDGILELQLNHGAKINQYTTNGDTPLHRAARCGHIYIVKLLLDNGAIVNAQDLDGKTPLHEAACSGKMSVVKILLNEGANVNAQTVNGDTPLHLVVAELWLKSTVQQLLNSVDVMYTQARGGATLEAALSGEMSIVKLLLIKDARVNVQTTKGYTPLHLAALYGQTCIVELLLSKEANVNALTIKGYTPLHLAAQFKQTSIVQVLLNNNADVNSQDEVGNTPLHDAVRSQDTTIVKQLLSKAADVNIPNDEGKTPLYLASELGSTPIVEQLSKVTDVNAQVTNKDTPLHGAARFGRTSTVKLLLDKSADINAQNTYGETPLHVAVRHEYVALVTLLVRRGADVMIRNKAGDTPLNYAMLFFFKGNERIVRLLQTAVREASNNYRLNIYRPQNPQDTFLSNDQDMFSNNSSSLQTDEFKFLKTTDTSGLSGQLYETKIVSLIFIRVLNHDQIEHDIFLGANIDGIGAMDDVCLRYRVTRQQKPTVLFMQAKHRADPEKGKLTDETLWSESGEFSLRKYFKSYLMIRERFRVGNKDPIFEGEFRDVDCYFVLYTTAKESLTKKKKENKMSEIVHDIINTGQTTEPFQYNYDQVDIDRLIEVAVETQRKIIGANSFPNMIPRDCAKKLVMHFLKQLWIYTNQAKEDKIEHLVKSKIGKHYNNERCENNYKSESHTNAIFLRAHYEIQKWWMLKGNSPYLNRPDDYFKLAKQAYLDNVMVTICNVIRHLKMSVDLEFNQRCHRRDFSFGIPKVFSKVQHHSLFKILDAKNKLITIDFESKNEIVNLLIADKEISGKNALPSNDHTQTLNHYLSKDQETIKNVAFKNNEQPKYSKRAGTSEVGGVLFRTKMLSLVHLRVLNHKQIEPESLLGNKLLGISVMSDICLRFRVMGQKRPVVLFMQLIHRENPEKGKLYDEALWCDSGDFSLRKYFMSYLIIKNRFQVDNEDPMFLGEFNNIDCYCILYTSAKESFTKKNTENKMSKVVQDLINTKQATEPFQYQYDEADIDRLCNATTIDQIEKLGIAFLPCLRLSEKYNPNLLTNKLIARYHVAMAREVLRPCEEQPDNAEYRLWRFRSELFNSDVEHLVIIQKIFAKIILSNHFNPIKIRNGFQQTLISDVDRKKLESSKFKLPLAFGNLDMTFRGREEKVRKRIKILADNLMILLELNKVTKVVEINDDDVGPGKTISRGIIGSNGGIGSAVGNLLVLDSESNMLKFDLENKTFPHNAALFLNELKHDRHKPFNEDLSVYRFQINVEGFPKDSFNADEYDKNQAKHFLSKFWIYTDQAKEDEVERIVKDEINRKYSDNIIRYNHNKYRNISDLILLHSVEEIQKWWMQTKESPYLSRASELFERAELADISNLLETVINYMYISDIQSIGIKVKRVNKNQESEQIHKLFKRIVVKLFNLFDPQFDEHFELRRYDYEISEESTLSLKIHPEMEWVALTVTTMKLSKFENANVKRCFVAKAGPGSGRRRAKDGFMLYELFLCGRLYRFKDCFKNSNMEFFIR